MAETTAPETPEPCCGDCGAVLEWEPYAIARHLAIGLSCPAHGIVDVRDALT